MGWLDKVPRTEGGGLFIGGLHALFQRQDLFKEYRISHVVSILDYEAGPFNDYKHLHVTLDDDPNENCLKILEHLPNTTKFIDDALSHGGAVFVHCAMGKSRSATVVMAYLMQKYGRSVDESLEQLREGRGVCGPNPGFMEQLHVYYHMLHAKEQSDADRIYSEWLKSRDTQRDWYSYQRQQSAAKL